MFDPAREHSRSLFSSSSQSRWLGRIHENARLLLTLRPIAPTSANGAPIHLLDTRTGRPSPRAQGVSFLLHGAVGSAIFLVMAYAPPQTRPLPHSSFGPFVLEYTAPNQDHSLRLGKDGGGGNNNPVPATRGNPAPLSRVQLLPPRLPDQQQHPLIVQPTIQDDQAPEMAPIVANLGLLTAKDYTNSAGAGQNGIGNRGRNGMGDWDGDGNGIGNDHGPYRPGVTPVMCAYCPDPLYTDEARKAKLQGTVTLRVLVGRDGCASDIRIVGGLGLGLDERAIETIRTWRFVPAKDAAHNPVPSWITIETVYRLF